ncbi:hypothetical protein R3P38DRAFT_1320514 [Favolaschia claudopus]|uniref:Uncharacterized protein n=1 Tax=Favolaschia claudopus TaxID=2862362 RepID=A0AAW0AWB2_9AGAR
MKALLLSLLPTPMSKLQQDYPDLDRLELATSVFRIQRTVETQSDVVIRWDEARVCLHWWVRNSKLPIQKEAFESVEFDKRSSQIAAELVSLAGLDPEHATASEMDAVNARFVRFNCSEETNGQRPTMRWRDCVSHTPDALHNQTQWGRLSPLVAANVRMREDFDDYTPRYEWCALYLSRRGFNKKKFKDTSPTCKLS